MPRYKLTIEYDGTGFAGWQSQPNLLTVQGAIQDAIYQFCGETVSVFGAGRTDTGVHATGQVAHIDLQKDWPVDIVRKAINAKKGASQFSILDANLADDDFDARFSAMQRHYIYKIIQRPSPLTFQRGYVWHILQDLNIEAMKNAANLLIGQHDFTTFRSAHCQAKSPIKTIDTIEFKKSGECIDFHICARSFMHRQVRSIMGSLVEVGKENWSVNDFQGALEAVNRIRCGTVAPPDGLYLTKILY